MNSSPPPIPQEGICAVWKPKGPTSFAIVAAIRRLTGKKKVGHAGTLDPLAEGVLVIGIGRPGTRELSTSVVKEKEYEAIIRLGASSSTDDEEGEIIPSPTSNLPSLQQIREILPQFTGTISQTPPLHSAVKIAGQPAYKLARKGKVLSLKPRQVEVKKIALLSYQWPLLQIRVITGPGVYIRSLARDIGDALGVGGYLTELVRTRVGEFDRKKCLQIPFTSRQNTKTRLSQE